MKKRFLVLAAVSAIVVTLVAVSCKRNIDQGNNFTPRATKAGHLDGAAGLPEATVPGVITGNVTLDAGHLWVLDSKCFVKSGGHLTIEEGTYVAAKKKSTSDSACAIIVTRGGQITAIGGQDNPIVFTSYESCPKSGDWGGVVLLGRAPLNRADTTIEGINKPSLPVEVSDVDYGGGGACQGDPMDNSGTLKYVRIEYAGTIISPDNELNGLTCGGVGAGTIISNVEVAYGNDDAFEFFGGTVNCDHLIALAPDDDAFDFDFGYNGSVQFAVSILKPGSGMDYSANPNGVESDNNATGDANTCKKTRPVISNMTVVGFCDSAAAATIPTAGLLNGAFFRRASAQYVHNSVFIGFPTGVNFSSPSAIDSAVNFQYNTVQAFNTVFVGTTPANNRAIRSAAANDPLIRLADPCDACSPDWKPLAGSTLLTDAVNFTGMSSFITPVTYRGAVAGSGAESLWPQQGWAKYDYEPYCIACGE